MSTNTTAALGRSRSLRRPAGGELAARDETRSQPKNMSPSRLPLKGSAMSLRSAFNSTGTGGSVASAGGSANVESNGASIGDKAKVVRGFLGRSNSLRQPAKEAAQGTNAKGGPIPSPLTRGSSLRKPQTSSSSTTPTEPSRPPITSRTRPTPGTRPTSAGSAYGAGRPTSSSGAPGPQPRQLGFGHSRAKSSATALTSATTLRPPEKSQATFSATRDVPPRTASATTATAGGAGERSRPPITSTTASRTAALHRRQASASTSTAASSTVSGLSRPHISSQTRKVTPPEALATARVAANPTRAQTSAAPPSGAAIARLRPAFNTNQQHYSPAKSLAPKPLMTSILAPPSPSKLPANVVASAETSRLQTELLQLSLMHRDAAAVDAQWRESARKKLGERFKALAKQNEIVSGLEKNMMEARNAQALQAWGARGGLEEKIQGLDAVLSGLWTLGEPGGKYARVEKRFERWADRMGQILAARDGNGNAPLLDEAGEVLFIGELDEAWKDECSALGRRLDEWRRVLRSIGDVPSSGDDEKQEFKSSLETILTSCQNMVADMLAELSLMEEIERDAVAREMEWIKNMNRENDDGQDSEKSRAGAIWRAL